jgi:hypothetical protein
MINSGFNFFIYIAGQLKINPSLFMKNLFVVFLIAFFFLLSEKSFSQTTTPVEKACYLKAAMLDSASGKPTVPNYDLNKPLPILLIKDTYACKCTIKTYEISIIRGKRPLASWTIDSDKVNLSSVREMVQTGGNSLIQGDRFMVSVTAAFSESKKCAQMPGGAQVFVGVFK